MPKPQRNCLVAVLHGNKLKGGGRAGLDTLAKSIGIGYWQRYIETNFL